MFLLDILQSPKSVRVIATYRPGTLQGGSVRSRTLHGPGAVIMDEKSSSEDGIKKAQVPEKLEREQSIFG